MAQYCTQYDNYGPRKLHNTGLKFRPYSWTLGGIRYANGDTFIPSATSVQPSVQSPPALGTPGKCGCYE